MESHSNKSKKHETNADQELNLVTLPADILELIFKEVQRQANGFNQLYQLTLVCRGTREIASDIITRNILRFNLKEFVTWYCLWLKDKSMGQIRYYAQRYVDKNNETISSLLNLLAENLATKSNKLKEIELEQIYALLVALLAGSHIEITQPILEKYIVLIQLLLDDGRASVFEEKKKLEKAYYELKDPVKDQLLKSLENTIFNLDDLNDEYDVMLDYINDIARKVTHKIFSYNSFAKHNMLDSIAETINNDPHIYLYEEDIAESGLNINDFLLQQLSTDDMENLNNMRSGIEFADSLIKIYTSILDEIMVRNFNCITKKKFKKYLDDLAESIATYKSHNNISYLDEIVASFYRSISKNENISHSLDLLKVALLHPLFVYSRSHRAANRFKIFAISNKIGHWSSSNGLFLSSEKRLKQAIIMLEATLKLQNEAQNNNNNNNNNNYKSFGA